LNFTIQRMRFLFPFAKLCHPQLQPGRIRHSARLPRRLPNQSNFHVGHTRHRSHFILYFRG
jgi:hypothetical protein